MEFLVSIKMPITIKMQKISDSPTPAYAHKGDSGVDLYAAEEHDLKPMERKLIPTGLKLEIPHGYEANIVISDRYYYSTIAFQATQGLDIKILVELNKEFLEPDIAFILDVKPEIALERIKTRKKEKFEQIEFMNKLREKFLELPKFLNDNIKIIDASKDMNEVFENMREEVNKVV